MELLNFSKKPLTLDDLEKGEREWLEGVLAFGTGRTFCAIPKEQYISVWWVHSTKRKKTIAEVSRYFYNGLLTLEFWGIRYSRLGGYSVGWEEDLGEDLIENTKIPFLPLRTCFFYNREKANEKVNSLLPPSVNPNDFKGLDDKLTFLRNMPHSEYFWNHRGKRWARDYGICHPKNTKKALKWWRANFKDARRLTNEKIINCLELGCKPRDLELATFSKNFEECFERVKRSLPKAALELRNAMKKLLLKNKDISFWDINHYLDYVCSLEKYGWNASKENILPMDLRAKMSAFSSWVREVDEEKREADRKKRKKEEKKESKRLTALADGLGKERLGGLTAEPLSTKKDFVEVGNRLHICVGTYGYSEKMARGQSYVFVIKSGNRVLECVEADDKEVLQCRGLYNGNSELHESVYEFATQYAKERSKTWANLVKTVCKNRQ